MPAPLAEPATIRAARRRDRRVPGRDERRGRRAAASASSGLPREALLNVIIRGEQAIPPRGSTRIEAGDRLHVLVRQEVAIEFRELLERWREGPVGPRARPRRAARRTARSSRARPWGDGDGDPAPPGRRSTASRSSSSCARAATCRARSSRSPTAATPSPARSSASARRGARRTPRARRLRARRRRRARLVAGGHRRAGAALNAQTCVGGLRSRRALHPARGPARRPRGRTRIRCAGRADGAGGGREAQARDLPERSLRLPVGDRPRRARRVRRPRRRRRPARGASWDATASRRRGSRPSTSAAGCARAATRRSASS